MGGRASVLDCASPLALWLAKVQPNVSHHTSWQRDSQLYGPPSQPPFPPLTSYQLPQLSTASGLTLPSSLPIIGQVMSVARQVAKMLSGPG